jgi:hypothetical protein
MFAAVMNWRVEGSTATKPRELEPMIQAAQFVGIMRELSVRGFLDSTRWNERVCGKGV